MGHFTVLGTDLARVVESALEARAAENLKRTTRTGGAEDLRTAMAYCEIRTVWHPARI